MCPLPELRQLAAQACGKRARRKDARPGELLDAALALFVEKGFAATRAEEVAKRAGVSKGTLFLYFSSKEELFKAVVRENISGRFSEWNTELETFEGNSADLLRSCVMSWWERVGSTKASGISKLMMSEAGNFPELAAFYQEEVVQPGNALIRKVLQRGVDAGEFRNLNVEYGVYLLLAPMMFLAMWQHAMKPCVSPTETFDPALYLQTHIDNLLMGLAVRPAAPLPREL